MYGTFPLCPILVPPLFGLRPRCHSRTHLEGAGWDEELSNIDPQAVYHTAWGDFGNRKTGFRGNAKRFLPQRPWITENKRQCMKLSLLANPIPPFFGLRPRCPSNPPCEDSIPKPKGYAGVHFQKTRKSSCHADLRVFYSHFQIRKF